MKMKASFRNILGTLTYWAIRVGAVVVYLIVGLALAVPYTYVSGGATPDSLSFGTLVLPWTVLVLVLLYQGSKSQSNDCWTRRVFGGIFWGLLGFVLLPVVTNLVSLGCTWFGFVRLGEFIFQCRYLSLLMVPTIAFMMLIGAAAVAACFRRKSSSEAPPPLDTPPSDSPGSSGDRVISTSRGPSEDMSQMQYA